MYPAIQEKLVSSGPCPGLVEEVGVYPPDKVQRGLVTHLRSNSCCVAELGPIPTSVCHQSLPSHRYRLRGPSSLIAFPSPLQVGSPRTTSVITSQRFQLPDLSSAPLPMQVQTPSPLVSAMEAASSPSSSSLPQLSCPKPKPLPASKMSQNKD